MKKMLVSLMLTGAMVLSVGSLVGCGRGFDTSENTLIIEVFEGGYGTTWATRLGELFEEKNPESGFDQCHGRKPDQSRASIYLYGFVLWYDSQLFAMDRGGRRNVSRV